MFCHPYIEDIEAIQSHVISWKNVSPEKLKFERLAGLSNKIWKVTNTNPSAHPKYIVFRKFGIPGYIDREKENYILRVLGEGGVGAEFYAAGETYRIERFYESEHLTPTELNEAINRRKLARVLAKLHSLKLDNLDSSPMFSRVLEGKDKLIQRAIEKANREEVYTREEFEKVTKILELTKEKEITFLKSILPKDMESVVFSHNDLHSDNILYIKKNKKLLIIDYEYSDYNFRGYDIANLFNEAVFEYHSTSQPYYSLNETKFPSQDEISDFIKYYNFFSRFDIQESEVERFLNDEDSLVEHIMRNYDYDLFMDEVKKIGEEVKACILFSHFYWILWSVFMSKRPDIKFDYISFAADRLEIYNKCKRKFFFRKGSRVSV